MTVTGPLEGEARSLNGAGATFPAPLYQKWFDEYSKSDRRPGQLPGYRLGRRQGSTGSDGRLRRLGRTDDRRAVGRLARWADLPHPDRAGCDVPTYNIPEVGEPLRFTAETLAGIFLGDIQVWNDPRLVLDNPQLAAVNQDIVVVHRSDGSGTTFGFTDYLSAVSLEWQQQVGKGTSVNWPIGLGASGNPGVVGRHVYRRVP